MSNTHGGLQPYSLGIRSLISFPLFLPVLCKLMCQSISASRGSGPEEEAWLTMGRPWCATLLEWCVTLLDHTSPSAICLQVQVSVCYEAQMVLYVFNRKNNCMVMSLWGSVSFIQSWRFHCVNYNCLLITDWNYSLRFFFFWIILRSEVLGMIKITWGNSICLCTSCLNRKLRACNWTNVLEIFYFHHVFICELLMVWH